MGHLLDTILRGILAMSEKEIIKLIREWLILNVRHNVDADLIEDNKALLKAIRDWKNEK